MYKKNLLVLTLKWIQCCSLLLWNETVLFSGRKIVYNIDFIHVITQYKHRYHSIRAYHTTTTMFEN